MAVVFCNNNINKVIYSGYTISKIYACGGSLVYGEAEPTVPPNWKEKFSYIDGVEFYGGVNFTTSGNVVSNADYTSYVYTYDGNYEYEYGYEYRGTDAIQNNVSALTINSGITVISAGTFSGCTKLVSATTIACCGVETIENSAFQNCTAMTDTNLTLATKTIRDNAFRGCSSLKEILLPSVVRIGINAFNGCSSTSNWRLSLPSTLTSISFGAFMGCTNLKVVIIDATTPPFLGEFAFDDCSPELKIYVPSASLEAYKTAQGWSGYADKIYPIA